MKNKITIMLMTVVSITIILIIVLVKPLFLVNNSNIQEELIEINEEENLEEVLKLPFGNGPNEIGIDWGGNEREKRGPTSFFVRNNNIYILDNVNKKIVMQSGDSVTEFPLKGLGWGVDIYVTKKKNIYVLDMTNRNIRVYNSKGKLLDKISVPEGIKIPTNLSIDYNKSLIVQQLHGSGFNFKKNKRVVGRHFENQPLVAIPKIVDDKTGGIKIKDKDKSYEITVDYEHSFGELIVLGIVGDQIVFEKTEVASNTNEIMAEKFIEVIDKKGRFQGAANVTLENMVYVPNVGTRVSNNKIYLLSVEEDGLKVYDVKVGKSYKKKL